MPCLVNAHLHLELSALKNCLPFDKGFKTWVKTLLEKREALGQDELMEKAWAAARELAHSGTLWVGDISTLGIGPEIIEDSGLNGISFHEFLGSRISSFVTRKKGAVTQSLAGHAPHTTAPGLLRALKKQCSSDRLPFSIHVAESTDESSFIGTAKGEWADFLVSRGIDWSSWGVGSKTPVSYIADMGLLDSLTIAVHLLNVDDADLDILVRSDAKICVCPRSNLNLHSRLPDIERMMQKGLEPALGTDSLASCDSLDIFDEMAFVAEHYPGIDPVTIFAMGTINGAKALGLEHLAGTLSTGKPAKFLVRSIMASHKKDIFEKIITHD
jgi:cytosine/adenosine deaminase-related metal-dependent hydrolase